ncbi:nucleoporin AMO1 [Drosophila grimshawi]|uniref:Nucleoporin NUP42 n=1 Tax=Drosophila grimshawi TaxID=7222 RepID=B4JR51_DROGR|nr:nucleoporin AMO1 [Drosophila grimshawi]EDV99381.1 GH13061 [Drosophila grimshawi]
MGVCRFFQQGSCRFGSKCHNEHFDVRHYLKTDIESGLNGKMWPFSVYGPFKDKPNLPNFIEDQSFEEVRLQAYESRRQNCFEQFHMQFSKEVHEATNKMKLLLQTTPQTIDVMIKLYELPESANQPAANVNSNPFGYVANASAPGSAAAVQTPVSIFSKPTLSASGGNIFGGAAATNTTNTSGGTNSFFGGNTATNTNLFGGATNTNIFAQQQQQPQQIFGQQQHAQQVQPGGIFGQQLQQQSQQQQSNLFTSAQPATNPSPFAFAPQQQQPQVGNIFGQAAMAPPTNTSSIWPNGFFEQATLGSAQQQQQMQSEAPQQMQQQQQQKPDASTSCVYSRLEDLTPEEIAAFKAEQFSPGQVPFKPPPRELC